MSTPEAEQELGEIVELPRLGTGFFESTEQRNEFVLVDHFDRWVEWYGPDDPGSGYFISDDQMTSMQDENAATGGFESSLWQH